MLEQGEGDGSFRGFRDTSRDRQVDLLDVASPRAVGGHERLVTAGEEEDPGCGAVQPMDEVEVGAEGGADLAQQTADAVHRLSSRLVERGIVTGALRRREEAE